MSNRGQYEIFCHLLVEARQKKGFKQSDLAGKLGRHQSYISKYETGERRLDVIEFLDVCYALSIKPESILKQMRSGKDKEE